MKKIISLIIVLLCIVSCTREDAVDYNTTIRKNMDVAIGAHDPETMTQSLAVVLKTMREDYGATNIYAFLKEKKDSINSQNYQIIQKEIAAKKKYVQIKEEETDWGKYWGIIIIVIIVVIAFFYWLFGGEIYY